MGTSELPSPWRKGSANQWLRGDVMPMYCWEIWNFDKDCYRASAPCDVVSRPAALFDSLEAAMVWVELEVANAPV